jgi:hypothetical protein
MTDPAEHDPQPEQQGDADQAANAAAAGTDKPERKKKKRWGKETETGLKVLAETETQPAAEGQQGEAQEGEQPAKKKRRSRWEPEEAKQQIVVAGVAAVLPANIAALVEVNTDPRVAELHRQLTIVSLGSAPLSSCWMRAVHACSSNQQQVLTNSWCPCPPIAWQVPYPQKAHQAGILAGSSGTCSNGDVTWQQPCAQQQAAILVGQSWKQLLHPTPSAATAAGSQHILAWLHLCLSQNTIVMLGLLPLHLC